MTARRHAHPHAHAAVRRHAVLQRAQEVLVDLHRLDITAGSLLGLLEAGVGLWQAQWREIVVFVLIILVLSVRPNGLFGARSLDKV